MLSSKFCFSRLLWINHCLCSRRLFQYKTTTQVKLLLLGDKMKHVIIAFTWYCCCGLLELFFTQRFYFQTKVSVSSICKWRLHHCEEQDLCEVSNYSCWLEKAFHTPPSVFHFALYEPLQPHESNSLIDCYAVLSIQCKQRHLQVTGRPFIQTWANKNWSWPANQMSPSPIFFYSIIPDGFT